MIDRRIFMTRCPGARRPSAWTRLALVAVAMTALAACSDTRKMLGLDKQSPDEFKIVSRAPLSLPPDYALRPPEPGAARPQEQTIPQRAVAAVTGVANNNGGFSNTDQSVGEQALLSHFGAKQADPNIRETVNRETSALVAENNGFMDHLMFWRSPEDPSSVVDAQKETQRLRENAALGKPVDDGQTPTITRRKKAFLEGVF